VPDVLQPGLTERLDDDPGHVLLNVYLHGDQGFQNGTQNAFCEQKSILRVCVLAEKFC
jgi:hypothetical protein